MLFSNKDIFKIITPILIQQILSIAIGMVDSVMVSSVGESAVSGVSLVNTINVLAVNFFSALAGGGAIVMAQIIGQKDKDLAKEASKQTLYITTLLALVLAIVVFVFKENILHLIFGKVDKDVMQYSQTYFFYTIISYPFIAVSGALASVCRAEGETKNPMFISLAGNGINVLGNAILIYGFNMGVTGAAIATLISHIASAIIILIFVLTSKKLNYKIDNILNYKPNKYLIKRICSIGVPNGFENSMFQIGRVMLSSLVSGFGTASIAANAVANTLTSFQYAQGNAVGFGMTTIVGRCVGAGELKQAKKNAKKLVIIAYGGMYIVSAILCLFSKFFIGLYKLSPASSEICTNIVLIHSLAVCLVWPIAFVLPNAFRSASDVGFTTVISLIAMWVFRIGLSFVFAYVFNMGVYSVWLAMFCDWIFRIIFFIPRYLSDKWLNKFKPKTEFNNDIKQVA